MLNEVFGLPFTIGTLVAAPLFGPSIIYLITAPNRAFSFDEYWSQRWIRGVALDVVAVLAGCALVVAPVAVAVSFLGYREPPFLTAIIIFMVAGGFSLFVRRNARYYESDTNPWLTAPLLPW